MRTLGIVVFISGAIVLLTSIIASQAVTEEVIEGVSGRDTTMTWWYLLGGFALVVMGGLMAMLDNSRR